jgi:hypothetical protein
MLPEVLTNGIVHGSMRLESTGVQDNSNGMRSGSTMKEPDADKFEVDAVQDAKKTEPDNDEEKRTERGYNEGFVLVKRFNKRMGLEKEEDDMEKDAELLLSSDVSAGSSPAASSQGKEALSSRTWRYLNG